MCPVVMYEMLFIMYGSTVFSSKEKLISSICSTYVAIWFMIGYAIGQFPHVWCDVGVKIKYV